MVLLVVGYHRIQKFWWLISEIVVTIDLKKTSGIPFPVASTLPISEPPNLDDTLFAR